MNSPLNRLAMANSPYLRQHADNPVDWYEWSEEALARARLENKPILISIGYAACHWCHVMAHESFMDREVASFMNHHFICIKVDREERPDIDQIYMEASQHFSGRGGWPLNAFSLKDGRPFFAGTYFPRNQWYELLKRIITIYEGKISELETQADALTNAIRSQHGTRTQPSLHREITVIRYYELFDGWEEMFDHQLGGFSAVPKFPLPVAWEFLLQYYYLTGNEKALNLVNDTLVALLRGGIYDQVGGGFSRYSTDKFWKVPHFEKMLYDNAQLISLYCHAFQVTGRKEYETVIRQTIQFLQHELMSDEGAFYSSLDADSEGEEGKYYTYTRKEIEMAIDPSLFALIAEYYQVTSQGNWENGRNILFVGSSKESFAKNHNLVPADFEKILLDANSQLLYFRNQRIPPSTDDKIITSWNALMIRAFVDAYHALGEDDYLKAALKTSAFIEKNMLNAACILQRSYKDGHVGVNGFLDDYALYAEALIRLYEATFDLHWLELSYSLTRFISDHFSDEKNPMFYYTSDISEPLIARKCEIHDHVIPSSNSVMANVLIKTGIYFNEESFVKRASDMLRQLPADIQGPYYANYAIAFGLLAYGPVEIAIVGNLAREKSIILQRNYLPTSIISGGSAENLPLLHNKMVKNKSLIYICKDKTCQLPVEEVETAIKLIR